MADLFDVALLTPPFSSLTYKAPPHLGGAVGPGMRVLVPLGRSLRVGVVLGPAGEAPPGVAVKSMLWPLEQTAMLDADYLDLAANLASRQLRSVGQVLSAVLPRGLRTSDTAFRLPPGEMRSRLKAKELARLDPAEAARLARAWEKGEMVPEPGRTRAGQETVSLAVDPPWPVRPGAVRQAELLEYLYEHGAVPRGVLTAALGQGVAAPLKALLRQGSVRLGEEEPPEACSDICTPTEGGLLSLAPSDEQAAALKELSAALASDEPESRLLHGVTGSGKTYVYASLARQCLASGRSTLILAPEVALACALHRAMAAEFPDAAPLLYHGYLPPGRREEVFRRAADKGPVMVVGTRSALFLPLPGLGLVVVDEEHDESYKQEERLSYQAKEVAFYRVRTSGGLLVLGSATPDVKTFHAARLGRMASSTLARRVADRPLPSLKLVDMGGEKEPGSKLSAEAAHKLRRTVESGDQAIIMLNRRGYSPLMYCLTCNEPLICPHCKVGMTYHKSRERLVCHYCGHGVAFPTVCPTCKGASFLPLGEGTEQLEERLRAELPADTPVLRLDSDSARRQERMEAILRGFARKEAPVLVGTQMLSKGHHFPGVTLVLVADADLGLNIPDYRASERAFQLLTQVSGRAGRGEKPGEVLIQTRKPGHDFWDFVMAGDYEAFYASEIAKREKYRYPPFVKLGLVRAAHQVGARGGPEAVSRLATALREAGMRESVMVLGPAPAPLSQLKGKMRYNCLLKAADWPAVRQVFARARAALGPRSPLSLALDLDPVNML